MPIKEANIAENFQKIIIQPNGPYTVRGGVSLVRKTPVISEHGEPLTWEKGETLRTSEAYSLCRCGRSGNKPFCDGTHAKSGFDGTETADIGSISQREVGYKRTQIVMNDDRSLCVHAGFCGNRVSNVWKMTQHTNDTQVRAQIMSMIERCPSGAFTYSLEPGGDPIEPDLPTGIAVIPDGPLWVSGGKTVERSDGQPLETRNRVTLCRCGASKNKPLCDGSHKGIGCTAE